MTTERTEATKASREELLEAALRDLLRAVQSGSWSSVAITQAKRALNGE